MSTRFQTYAQNWINFYTKNPAALVGGISVTLASYGAAFGDAVGVDLLNVPPGGAIQDAVKNALFDNAQGIYKVGVSIFSQPTHQEFQGGTSTTFNLTPNIDNFSTSAVGATFNAFPLVTALGIAVNTLNIGDNLKDSASDGVLNFVTAPQTIGANPSFATSVTMNGVATANINGQSFAGGLTAGLTGFQGTISGLKVANYTGNDALQLGGASDGLLTLPTNINVSGYGGPADEAITLIVAQSAADLTKSINFSLSGVNLGGTAAAKGAGSAMELIVANDTVAGGTTANPNNSYGTWAITANNNANLALDQDLAEGVGGATNLVLAGAGNIAVGQDAAGDWQFLKGVDSSKATGKVFITGSASGNASNVFASAANPGWLFGSTAGLLDDTGTTFALTSAVLGSGLTILDASSASATQLGKLTTGAGTGVTLNAGNEIIVQDSVATTTSASTFATISGFSILGIGGAGAAQGASGKVDMANLPTSINDISFVTTAAGAFTINNGVSGLTVDVNHNSAAGINPLTVNGPGGTSDSVTIILGDAAGNVGGIAGAAVSFANAIDGLTTTGYETVTIKSNGPAGGGNVLSGVSKADVFAASPGASLALNLQGTDALFTNSLYVDGLGGTGVINDSITSTLDIWAFGTNAVPSVGAGATFVATNAAAINAATSGGVFMGGSDVFFNGLVGDILTGSAAKSNVLAGSVSNDTFTGGTGTDWIITDNGGDIINLGLTHTGDHIDLFFGNFLANNGGFNGTVKGTFTAVTGLANSTVGPGDIAAAGSWGLAPALTAAFTPAAGTLTPFALFPHTSATNNGTSADMSVVSNFSVGGPDVLDISVAAWSRAGLGNGLMMAHDFTFIVANEVAPGADAVFAPGGVVPSGSVVPVGVTVVEVAGAFANANALALALGNNVASGGSTYHLLSVGAPAGLDSHFLVAYQDTTSAVRIADVDITGASLDLTGDAVVASDIVQLTGVSLTNLTTASIHFVA